MRRARRLIPQRLGCCGPFIRRRFWVTSLSDQGAGSDAWILLRAARRVGHINSMGHASAVCVGHNGGMAALACAYDAAQAICKGQPCFVLLDEQGRLRQDYVDRQMKPTHARPGSQKSVRTHGVPAAPGRQTPDPHWPEQHVPSLQGTCGSRHIGIVPQTPWDWL